MKRRNRLTLLHFAAVFITSCILPAMAIATVNAAEPEKPAELANRQSKEHVFEYTLNPDGEGGSYEYAMTKQNTLIMPGDTFTFKVYKSGVDEDDFYYSLKYWNDEKKAYIYEFDGEASEYSFVEGVDASTAVEVTATQTIQKKGENADSYEVPVSFKNRSSYPILIGLNMSGSAGQYGQSYLTRGLTVKYLKPYYPITYSFGESDDLFWPLGEYDNLDFPSCYWITDTPYTIRIPNPVKEGSHFAYWSAVSKNNSVDKGDYTDVTVFYDPDAEYPYTSDHMQSYGNKSMTPLFDSGNTITFYGNGGKVNGRDKWVLEVSKDDSDSENPVYDFNLDPAAGDAIAARDDDTFLGWCTKESALYNFVISDNYDENHHISGSFVTKDSAAEACEALSLSGSSSISNNWGRGVLYAKWASETQENLEKNGYDLLEDGTLWLLNNYGVRAWADARNADEGLAAKVTDIKTGYKDETVTNISDGFENCTGLTKITMNDMALTCSFKGCTNLKEINLDPGTAVHYTSSLGEEQFEGTSLDLVIHVPEDKLEYYRSDFSEYAYLFNADTSDQRYPLTVNGKILSDKNLTVACGDGTATFDPAAATLTLDHAELSNCINLHNVSSRYWNTENEYYAPYNEAVIVSNLPSLKIILKGKNVVKRTEDYQLRDLVRAYGDVELTGDGSIEGELSSSHYFVQDDNGESVPYVGVCKLPVTGFESVTIDGITAKRLMIHTDQALTLKNASLDGGQYSSGTSLSLENVILERGYSSGGPEDTEDTTVGGKSVMIDGCVFHYVTFDTDENTEKITIKNSNIQIQGKYGADVTLSAGENTLLVIENSSFKAYSKEKGVTNIPKDNITLTDCVITNGGWTENNYFTIEPVNPETYEVAFQTNGGSPVDAQKVIYGNTATKPKDPSKTGYIFDGWYGDSALGKTFDFNTKIVSDTTIYAKWKTAEASSEGGDQKTEEDSKGSDSTGGTTGSGGTTGGTTGSGSTTGGSAASTEDKIPTVGTTIQDQSGSAIYKVKETSKDSSGKAVVKVIYTAPTSSGSKKTTVTIPDTVTLKDGTVAEVIEIAANAFKNNAKLTKVTVGKNVKTIGNSAFSGCKKLKTANLGSKVAVIGNNAFAKCTSLTGITIPKTVTSIGTKAFYGDKKCKTITIKSTKLKAKTVSKNAFKGITSKTTIKVPKAKKKAYTTLLRKKGLSGKVGIK